MKNSKFLSKNNYVPHGHQNFFHDHVAHNYFSIKISIFSKIIIFWNLFPDLHIDEYGPWGGIWGRVACPHSWITNPQNLIFDQKFLWCCRFSHGKIIWSNSSIAAQVWQRWHLSLDLYLTKAFCFSNQEFSKCSHF